MKTRNKLLILQIITLLTLVLSIISFQHIQQREQKLYLRTKSISDKLIIDNILKFNEAKYISAAKTNSCWNEIVDFCLKPDTIWAKLAIGEIISTFQLNYIQILNASKENIYEIYQSINKQQSTVNINSQMINALFKESPFCHFFTKTNAGYLEIFGSTIVRVDDIQHQGKAYGYLLIGKLWNADFIKELENVSGFNINMTNYANADTTKIAFDKQKNIVIYNTLNDWQNKPIARLQIFIKNKLFQEFYFSKYLSIFIALFSILTVFFFFIAVRKWISKPLSNITTSLNTANIKYLDKIIDKKNEFGEISRLINQFYIQKNNLEKEIAERLNVEKQLTFANENLEHKVNERTNDLIIINKSLEAEIKERKNAEAIINKQIDALETKNIEMERFTYTVSHDLKSPLITINGFAGLIQEKIKNKEFEDLDDDISRILNATNKMQELLKDLLELSKIGRITSPSTTFSMSALANEVVELLHGIIKTKNINIVIDHNMPDATADKQRIKEVIQNLLENAVKFMNNNENPIIKIGYKEIDHQIAYFVQDNAMGIEPKYHQKIFGLFDKLNQHSEGTGIGLAIVKRIIELHKGKVWVESEPNKGATFYFTINTQNFQ